MRCAPPSAPEALGVPVALGVRYGRPARTQLHRRWLAGLKFEQPVRHLVLEDYIQVIEAAQTRRDRLTAQIKAMLTNWTLAPVVAALQKCAAWNWQCGDAGRRTW